MNTNVKVMLSRGMTMPTYATEGAAAVDMRAAIDEGTTVTIQPGERIAQLLITPVLTPAFEEVAELTETQRGAGGFGSTGK